LLGTLLLLLLLCLHAADLQRVRVDDLKIKITDPAFVLSATVHSGFVQLTEQWTTVALLCIQVDFQQNIAVGCQ
jgi:hypothetical protein